MSTSDQIISDKNIINLSYDVKHLIFEHLNSMRSVNNLRATCQDLNAVFMQRRRYIVRVHQEKILTPFLEYYDRLSQILIYPEALKYSSPSWNLSMPGKSSFLVEIMNRMAFFKVPDAPASRWTNARDWSDASQMKNMLALEQHHKWLAGVQTHLIVLTRDGSMIMNTMTAEFWFRLDWGRPAVSISMDEHGTQVSQAMEQAPLGEAVWEKYVRISQDAPSWRDRPVQSVQSVQNELKQQLMVEIEEDGTVLLVSGWYRHARGYEEEQKNSQLYEHAMRPVREALARYR